MTAFARERELAERAAREAGAIVRRWYERGVGVAEKAPDNPVTRADLEANACIRALLAAAFPDDGWLSEETADSTERLRQRRVWVVDPLDGTKEFIQHIPEFCVCIALVEDGRPVVAVEYNPAADRLYAAARGQGATVNGAPAHVTRTARVPDALVLASRPTRREVGHDAVDAEVEETLHLRLVVDGPHVHLEAERMGGRDRLGGHDRRVAERGRHLEGDARRAVAAEATVAQAEDELRHLRRREAGQHVGRRGADARHDGRRSE